MTTTTAARPRRRIRTLLGAAAATLALTGSLVATAPAPAATAATSYGYATVCFTHPGGAAYTATTYAEKWVNGKWTTTSAAGTRNGCRTWTLASGSWFRFYAYAHYPQGLNGTWFISNYSGMVQAKAGVNYGMGTHTVTQNWY